TMVGLDVTHQIMLSAQHLDQLAGAQPVIGEDLRAIAQLYLAFYRQRSGLDGCHMHDATAIAFLLRPDLFKGKSGRIEIIRAGVQAGRSILHPDRKARHTALVKVDHQACLQLWLDTIAASWLK
ncbi:MAG: nucleoside hydrolase, partial [Pseudomonadota bacterium]